MKKQIFILGTIIVAIILLFFVFLNKDEEIDPIVSDDPQDEIVNQEEPKDPIQEEEQKEETIIGQSVKGEDIKAYHFGEGDKEVVFVGGIHGGYGWNTALLAYQAIDYLKNEKDLSENLKVTIIPVLNPDGLKQTIGTADKFTLNDLSNKEIISVEGRFNGNGVDINRNFDCEWESEGVWRNETVNGGSSVFSEPEAQAVKTYIETKQPEAVVIWYSAAGGVFSSSCKNGISTETRNLTKLYADASGYQKYDEFASYEITGDMANWLAKVEIPAISVLLTDHLDTEWEKNKKGIDAVINHYSNSN